MKHELKIWPQYYFRVADGSKTFEVRKNDRGFQPGDDVVLREYDPDEEWSEDDHFGTNFGKGVYSGNKMAFKIGYVLSIDAERVVFSLLPLESK